MKRDGTCTVETLERREFFSAADLTTTSNPPTEPATATFTADVQPEPARDVFCRSKPHIMPPMP